jgi:hypothetical protein
MQSVGKIQSLLYAKIGGTYCMRPTQRNLCIFPTCCISPFCVFVRFLAWKASIFLNSINWLDL